MAGSLDILFRIIARARAASPFYFTAPTAPPPSATMLYFILLYFYSVLPVCVFFCRVIFRQPLALCCAVAGRRRVSARISWLSWHRFIVTITPGIAARTIFKELRISMQIRCRCIHMCRYYDERINFLAISYILIITNSLFFVLQVLHEYLLWLNFSLEKETGTLLL